MTPIYYLKEANLSFGDKIIFANLELSLQAGDKICLIGRNGSGKSTLMKVISRDYELDSGEIFIAPHTTTAYLKQDIATDLNLSIYDFVLAKFDNHASNKYSADIILSKLDLPGDKLLINCSGGQIRRAYLAKVLISQPEILLLDEPTNHLDIKTIEWLEEYIKSYKGAVICISHDRQFLSNVTNKIWWLDRSILRKSDNGFKYFDQWQDTILQQEEATQKKLNKKLDQENQWLSTGVTARRKRNQKRLADLKVLRQQVSDHSNRLGSIKQILEADNIQAASKSKFIIEAESISFAYQDKTIINNFSFKIKRGEKIGIIGPNGSGKSTFVNIITGKIQIQNGNIRYGKDLKILEIDQHKSGLKQNETLQQNLCSAGGDQILLHTGSVHVASYLRKFMFDPKTASAKVATLSGGEASRLMLAKTLINPGDLLILDEPTNDLDMDTLEILLELLCEYNGTLMIVSHDRDFLNRLVDRIFVFDDSKIADLVGNYDDYKEFVIRNKATSKNNKTIQLKTEINRAHDISIKNSKTSYKNQRLLETIPLEIERLEKIVRELERKLSDNNLYTVNPNEFISCSQEIVSIQSKIDELTNQWLNIK
ncbi:MAG: ABC transporter ATP-binding protein [Rickettsiaceae bacterium]|nr:MAG: ABC transporter ATP-binding protein [Rickettsiaceae bacterium]